MDRKEELLREALWPYVAHQLNSPAQDEHRLNKAYDVCVNYSDQETKELNQQLTEANALIEIMQGALHGVKNNDLLIYYPDEVKPEHEGEAQAINEMMNEVNTSLIKYIEYKTKQTTQEVKP